MKIKSNKIYVSGYSTGGKTKIEDKWRNTDTSGPSSALKEYPQQIKLEDLKVLRRSPDIFNYVKIGQGQLQLIIKHILFYHIWGLQPFWSSD